MIRVPDLVVSNCDVEKAAQLYCLCADSQTRPMGFRLSVKSNQCHLASLYEDGRGIAQYAEEFMRLFRLTADHGNARGKHSRAAALARGSRGTRCTRLCRVARGSSMVPGWADHGDASMQTQ
jgi:TPR repeat protein